MSSQAQVRLIGPSNQGAAPADGGKGTGQPTVNGEQQQPTSHSATPVKSGEHRTEEPTINGDQQEPNDNGVEPAASVGGGKHPTGQQTIDGNKYEQQQSVGNRGPAEQPTIDGEHIDSNGHVHPSSSSINGEHRDATPTTNGKQPEVNDPQVNGRRPTATTELKEILEIEKKKFAEKKDKVKSKANPPGGYDPTPLPDAPPGYTLKFTFHKAYNLPIADLKTNSADPFLHATLTAAVPKRHKEDPPLTRRTPTIRKSTEPVWEDEWIVANIPSTGFTLKCRLYDEDWPDHDDRLGNVTIKVPHVDENWEGFGSNGQVFEVKKRSGSKRAYLLYGITKALCHGGSMTPQLHISIQVVGKSDPPHAQMYTVGPATWVKHFSPMIGRLTGTKVNKNEDDDAGSTARGSTDHQTKKYDFQASEIQLAGPVPPNLYHRYVEFRPMIGRMFSSRGLRGRILNTALHRQHARVYNYDATTEHGTFKPCSEEASLQFLKMAHFDEGGRIFTYVITLDGMMRFTETGKEFGIDLLSKHTMHSDVATYIACAGEFFIRRLAHHDSASSPHPHEVTHPPDEEISGGPPKSPPPRSPHHYQLIIDNDSGTYRPDKSILPDLKKFLEKNFPGLGIVTMHCADEELTTMKKEQMEMKKREGNARVRMVLNRSPSASSFGSDDESRLADIERAGDRPFRSKKETVFDIIQNPTRWREYFRRGGPSKGQGSSDVADGVVAPNTAPAKIEGSNTSPDGVTQGAPTKGEGSTASPNGFVASSTS